METTRLLTLHLQSVPAHGPIGRADRFTLTVRYRQTVHLSAGPAVEIECNGTVLIVDSSHVTEHDGRPFKG